MRNILLPSMFDERGISEVRIVRAALYSTVCQSVIYSRTSMATKMWNLSHQTPALHTHRRIDLKANDRFYRLCTILPHSLSFKNLTVGLEDVLCIAPPSLRLIRPFVIIVVVVVLVVDVFDSIRRLVEIRSVFLADLIQGTLIALGSRHVIGNVRKHGLNGLGAVLSFETNESVLRRASTRTVTGSCRIGRRQVAETQTVRSTLFGRFFGRHGLFRL